jgi:hypothetical protein
MGGSPGSFFRWGYKDAVPADVAQQLVGACQGRMWRSMEATKSSSVVWAFCVWKMIAQTGASAFYDAVVELGIQGVALFSACFPSEMSMPTPTTRLSRASPMIFARRGGEKL